MSEGGREIEWEGEREGERERECGMDGWMEGGREREACKQHSCLHVTNVCSYLSEYVCIM